MSEVVISEELDFDPADVALAEVESPPARQAIQYPLSFSRLSLIEACHLRYWHERVARTPLEQEVVGIQPFAVGRAFHDHLADVLIETIVRYRLYGELFVPERWVERFDRFAMDEPFKRKWRTIRNNVCLWMAERGIACWATWLQPGAVPLVEWPVALDLEGNFAPWSGNISAEPARPDLLFRGVLDFACYLPATVNPLTGNTIPAHVQLWDWKTSRYRYRSRDDYGVLSPQLGIYAWILFRAFPDIEYVLATFYNVMWRDPEPPALITREEADRFGPEYISRVVGGVQGLDPYDPEAWEPKENEFCWLCSVRPICPVQRLAWFSRAREAYRNELEFAKMVALPAFPPVMRLPVLHLADQDDAQPE